MADCPPSASRSLDVAVLDEALGPAELLRAGRRLPWSRRLPATTVFAVFLLALIGVAAWLLAPALGPIVAPAAAVVALLVIALQVRWLCELAHRARLSRLAAAHGLGYADELLNDARPGLGFAAGSRNVGTATILREGGAGWTAIGRNAPLPRDGAQRVDLRRPFVFIEIALPTDVPHLVLVNRRSRILSTLAGRVGPQARVRFAGDVGGVFTGLCPAGYERDVLRLFGPELLAALLDLAPRGELELVDRRAYLYLPAGTPLWRADTMRATIELGERVERSLLRASGRYRDERSMVEGTVAAAGRRVRHSGGRSAATLLWAGLVVVTTAAVVLPGLLRGLG